MYSRHVAEAIVSSVIFQKQLFPRHQNRLLSCFRLKHERCAQPRAPIPGTNQHPDIVGFIGWGGREGSHVCARGVHGSRPQHICACCYCHCCLSCGWRGWCCCEHRRPDSLPAACGAWERGARGGRYSPKKVNEPNDNGEVPTRYAPSYVRLFEEAPYCQRACWGRRTE